MTFLRKLPSGVWLGLIVVLGSTLAAVEFWPSLAGGASSALVMCLWLGLVVGVVLLWRSGVDR